jgi:thymidylate kinase
MTDKAGKTFTAQELIEWAEKQKKEFAGSVFTKEVGSEAYEQALNHLIHHVKYPVEEII